MVPNPKQRKKLAPIWNAIAEIGLITFLLYSTLLMREFTHANGEGKNLAFAVYNIFTVTNFVIAIISGLLGYIAIEYFRERN
jgi:uncharacterized protein with PQ loop repeat